MKKKLGDLTVREMRSICGSESCDCVLSVYPFVGINEVSVLCGVAQEILGQISEADLEKEIEVGK